jgi:hypothetical protein
MKAETWDDLLRDALAPAELERLQHLTLAKHNVTALRYGALDARHVVAEGRCEKCLKKCLKIVSCRHIHRLSDTGGATYAGAAVSRLWAVPARSA